MLSDAPEPGAKPQSGFSVMRSARVEVFGLFGLCSRKERGVHAASARPKPKVVSETEAQPTGDGEAA